MAWETILEDLDYPESLRWHDGSLWLSDFYQHRVICVRDGSATTLVEVAGQPSGLGWLPDGSLIVVDMHERKLLRRQANGAMTVHADLMPWCRGLANDLLVMPNGSAYVGHLGFDFFGGESFQKAELLHVTLAGEVSVAASELAVPNGCLVSRDGAALILAETFAGQLTRFRRSSDGSLDERRVWCANLGMTPDGMCWGRGEDIWVADSMGSRILRIVEGRVAQEVPTPAPVFSCVVGGADNRVLFAGVADGHDPATTPPGTGRVVAMHLPG